MAQLAWPRAGRPAILVTGASSGIGAELAREAARQRLPLVLIARTRAALDNLATELTAAGTEAHVLSLDLRAPDAAAAIGAMLAERGLVCDVLVNNAGYGSIGAAAALPGADQLGILDLNLRAAAALTLAALPGMLERRHGGVLNMGSIAAFMPGPGMAMYYVSKAGLRSLSEALWAEARGHGVVVTFVAPGPVRTPFLVNSGARDTRLFRMLPKADARTVAKRGWAGFHRGKRLVFPDMASRLIAHIVPLLPRRLLLAMMHRLQRRR